METDEVIDFTPPSEADPLHQRNKRIERTKNYLRWLEEAIATAKGLSPATASVTQNPYLSAALSHFFGFQRNLGKGPSTKPTHESTFKQRCSRKST
jgi:hypothetical protein